MVGANELGLQRVTPGREAGETSHKPHRHRDELTIDRKVDVPTIGADNATDLRALHELRAFQMQSDVDGACSVLVRAR
jgi:hypothetical protein